MRGLPLLLLLLPTASFGCGVRDGGTRAAPAAGVQAAPLPEPSKPFGFGAPVVIANASFERRWVVACFALADTDGDGHLRVTIGRHGDVWGDELRPFVLFWGRHPEAVDEYVAASPDRRFVAVVAAGRLFAIDSQTQARLDLSSLGVDLGHDTSPALPHPAIAFSTDSRAAIVRRSAGNSEVLLVDLVSGQTESVFRTRQAISRFELSPPLLRVWLTPRGTVDRSLHTTLAPRRCRAKAAVYSVFRSQADPTKLVEVGLPAAHSLPAEPEYVAADAGLCTTAGLPSLASSRTGAHLVASARDDFHAEHGPLRWAEGELYHNACHSAPAVGVDAKNR